MSDFTRVERGVGNLTYCADGMCCAVGCHVLLFFILSKKCNVHGDSYHKGYFGGTSGFAVLRYRVSFLRGIAVLRAKIGGIAVLSFYSAVCGIVIYQHPKFMKYHFPDKERSIFETNSWRKGKHRRMGILFVFLHLLTFGPFNPCKKKRINPKGKTRE